MAHRQEAPIDSLVNCQNYCALERFAFAGALRPFKGGRSAGQYASITGAAPATAGRDLAELVSLGALVRTGQLKGTRYWLHFSDSWDELAE